MGNPTVSVIMPAFRPGGLDITFCGLSNQTCTDFEFILVDHRYEKRRQEVRELAKECCVNTIHIPEHRRNGKWAVVASAWNTGFMLARGKLVLALPDYCYVHPTWIERHVDRHRDGQRKIVLAPYTFLELPPVLKKDGTWYAPPPPETAGLLPPRVTDPPGHDFDEISIFEQPFNPMTIESLRPWPATTQCLRDSASATDAFVPKGMMIHFRNESLPRDLLWSMNGLDENLDRGKSHIDTEFGRRFEMLGLPMEVDPDNRIFIINPRTLFPTMPQHGPGRWDYPKGETYALGTSRTAAPNPYNWATKMNALQSWRVETDIAVEGLDVRDEDYYQ